MGYCEHTNVSWMRQELLAYRCEYDPDTESVKIDWSGKVEEVDVLDSYLVCDDCSERLHVERIEEG